MAKKIRILLAKPGLDGHDRGIKVLASAFRDAGMEVIYTGLRQTPEMIVSDAVQEDVDAIGVSILSGAHMTLFPAILDEMKKRGAGDIMLFGGGISLGGQMFKTGLAKTLGQGFIELTGVSDLWTLTAVGIAFTIFFTEVCSNTATSSMVVPLIIGVAIELGVSPIPPALGVGLAASCAFMMPIATGPNAIVYGTGEIALPDMIRIGALLNLICGVVIFAILRLLCPLYGWT